MFTNIDPDAQVEEIESLCMACRKTGTTRLLLTKIPFFKELIIMAFSCPECGHRSNQVEFGGSISPKGVVYTLTVDEPRDLEREIVKSEFATVRIEELDFEIPPQTQKGIITTLEGLMTNAHDQLDQTRMTIQQTDPENAAKLQHFLESMTECIESKRKFTLKLDDPSGNSFIQNFKSPERDEKMVINQYKRTDEQQTAMGYAPEESINKAVQADVEKTKLSIDDLSEEMGGEIIKMEITCPSCRANTESRMLIASIPKFKEVIIMALKCESCGYKTVEVKPSGGISDTGVRLTLKVQSVNDLNRDVLKGDHSSLAIPEVGLQLEPGTLGGKYTTIEGIVDSIEEQLRNMNAFDMGDSSFGGKKDQFAKFLDDLNDLKELKRTFTLVLDDPAGNSYIQALDPSFETLETVSGEKIGGDYSKDERLTVEHYTRSKEMDEELGLLDMKTENYDDQVDVPEVE